MKIENSSVIKFLYDSAIKKKKLELEEKGFHVELEYRHKNVIFDLYAELGETKYIYEFKIAKNTRIDGLNNELFFGRLQQAAKDLGARLYVIYIKTPQEGVNVSFEELGDILQNDLSHKTAFVFSNLNNPSLLDIFDISIFLINIEKESIYLSGSFTADVEFLLTSKESFDKNPLLAKIGNEYMDISYEIQISKDFETIKSDYSVFSKSA